MRKALENIVLTLVLFALIVLCEWIVLTHPGPVPTCAGTPVTPVEACHAQP